MFSFCESRFVNKFNVSLRNFGILIAFKIFFMCVYLLAAEYITTDRSKGEVLIFRRGHSAPTLSKNSSDEETGQPERIYQHEKSEGHATQSSVKQSAIHKSQSVFHWKDVCYDISIKGNNRRILDKASGWVKPGTLTALMVSLPPFYEIIHTDDRFRALLALARLLFSMSWLTE